MTMKVSKFDPPYFLGPAVAERLLTEWANIPDPHVDQAQADAAIRRLVELYPQVFRATLSDIPYFQHGTVLEVQGYLRKAWEAPDARQRDWYIFKVRDSYRFSTERGVWEPRRDAAGHPLDPTKEELDQWNGPPPLTFFEQVMYHFHRISLRARRCENESCPAPYFFIAKKGQKYCSVKCSAPALREQKRRWWEEHRARV